MRLLRESAWAGRNGGMDIDLVNSMNANTDYTPQLIRESILKNKKNKNQRNLPPLITDGTNNNNVRKSNDICMLRLLI